MKNKKTKTELFSQFQKERALWQRGPGWIFIFIVAFAVCDVLLIAGSMAVHDIIPEYMMMVLRCIIPEYIILVLSCVISVAIVVILYRYFEGINNKIKWDKEWLEHLKEVYKSELLSFNEAEQKWKTVQGITDYLQNQDVDPLWREYISDVTELEKEGFDEAQKQLDEKENEVYEQETKVEFYIELAAKEKKYFKD
ncbi:MAG: hypothetical protein NTY80_01975 [candidate division SR1 bacterium]|nr:hypothetical protein [candidate division SR1 bacterium]